MKFLMGFAVCFLAISAMAAVADVHQWQTPAGFYQAGARVSGVDQTGQWTAANGYTVGGVKAPVAPLFAGIPSGTQLNSTWTHCTLTDAGTAGTPKCSATISRNYIDGGAPICNVVDPANASGVTFSLSSGNSLLTVSGGAANEYGDVTNIACMGP